MILFAVIVSCFMLELYGVYTYVKPKLEKDNGQSLVERQRGYLMSIKVALTMFGLSLWLLFKFGKAGMDIDEYLGSLSFEDKGVMIVSLAYFTAYLLIDIYIGSKEYPDVMNTLGGYLHHVVYILINIYSLYAGNYPVYLLFMVAEMSTILLASGNIDKRVRSDKWFGITFLFSRIVLFTFLVYKTQGHLPVYLCYSILVMHIYWFYNWFNKYGKILLVKHKE